MKTLVRYIIVAIIISGHLEILNMPDAVYSLLFLSLLIFDMLIFTTEDYKDRINEFYQYLINESKTDISITYYNKFKKYINKR